ncbi:MAG: hypothetical protein ACK5VE_03580 [Alphaproteobacteria bacterium]|jgi:hypothetical protein
MIVVDPRFAEVRYVLENLRAKSREDVFGASDVDPAGYARYLANAPGFHRAVYYQGKPAAVFGAIPMHKGVWSLYGMGTDDWISVWRLVTLVCKRDIVRAVLSAGAHRAECLSPATHEDTHKWLRFLGLDYEVPVPQYGKGGEDYILFAWLKDRADVWQEAEG